MPSAPFTSSKVKAPRPATLVQEAQQFGVVSGQPDLTVEVTELGRNVLMAGAIT
jgi:hypothetical protein